MTLLICTVPPPPPLGSQLCLCKRPPPVGPACGSMRPKSNGSDVVGGSGVLVPGIDIPVDGETGGMPEMPLRQSFSDGGGPCGIGSIHGGTPPPIPGGSLQPGVNPGIDKGAAAGCNPPAMGSGVPRWMEPIPQGPPPSLKD